MSLGRRPVLTLLRNLIPTKEFFFFGSDSFEPKALSSYLKGEKNIEHAHHNISWASHTGKGLLFIGDKKAPSNVINLVCDLMKMEEALPRMLTRGPGRHH